HGAALDPPKLTGVMTDKERDKKIKAETEELTRIFSDLPAKKMSLAGKLIERAAWMRVQCQELEEYLEANGWTEKFQQTKGLPPYDRSRPQAQSYLTLNSGYQKIIKQLSDLLPRDDDKPKDDGFDSFVNRRDDE
ncbi:MAG: hypothetical protein LUD25_05460, partial [Coriobacteriaceae bacterium]|nr:hypothetical protein [Coriobacteriaceae bacterium]